MFYKGLIIGLVTPSKLGIISNAFSFSFVSPDLSHKSLIIVWCHHLGLILGLVTPSIGGTYQIFLMGVKEFTEHYKVLHKEQPPIILLTIN